MASLLTAHSLRPSARGPQLHTFIPRTRSVHPWLAVETARLPGIEAPAPALPLMKGSRGQRVNSPAPWPLNEKGPDALSKKCACVSGSSSLSHFPSPLWSFPGSPPKISILYFHLCLMHGLLRGESKLQCPQLGFPGGSDGEESACSAGDPGTIPGSGRSPGGGHGNPLQCSCLENPTDGGACWVAGHGAAKSQTQPRRLTCSLSTAPWLAASSPLDVSSAFSSRKPLLITNQSNVSPPPPQPCINGRAGF